MFGNPYTTGKNRCQQVVPIVARGAEGKA